MSAVFLYFDKNLTLFSILKHFCFHNLDIFDILLFENTHTKFIIFLYKTHEFRSIDDWHSS